MLVRKKHEKNVQFVFIIDIKDVVSIDSIACVDLCYDYDAQTDTQLA